METFSVLRTKGLRSGNSRNSKLLSTIWITFYLEFRNKKLTMMDNFRFRSGITNRILETEGYVRRRIREEYRNKAFRNDFGKQETHILEDDFALECLRSHNHFRAEHGCAPLHLSAEVSRFSQQWADRLALENHLRHSHHPRYGENLFVTYLSDNSLPMTRGNEVVESWYSEHKHYPFNEYVTRETLQKTGHFTQVVWSNSRELGVGRAVSKSNRVYVVANYNPAGNITNKIHTNVPQRILASHHPHLYSNRVFANTTQICQNSWTGECC